MKLGELLAHVESCLQPGAPAEVLVCAIEDFAASGKGRWLKVAGGAKSEVLWDAVLERYWLFPSSEIVLECGTFVGYSTLRLAHVCTRKGWAKGPWAIVSVEVNPVQACLARHFVDLARASRVAEIWVGQVRDVLPRSLEEFSQSCVGLLFMDHKGSAFHTDFAQAEWLNALSVSSKAVIDNVVSPGAPLLLWRAVCDRSWATRVWALKEFLEPDQEDWMVVVTIRRRPDLSAHPTAPEELRVLAWQAEHFRRRSEGYRPAEAPVRPGDRASFAHEVADMYRRLGVQATPWQPALADAKVSNTKGRHTGLVHRS
mmetsp:Transcript_57129/g.133189  ORF Transcript_57129/g.133189 Transcript_57129/m.133189 type:complete len:314 (-) Transcript_57129:29-970(-)